MKFRLHRERTAFSLVELMVVIGIISLLATIIFASLSSARENTREKKRISDLANIEFALTVYNEKEREFPQYPNGIEIGAGGAIDDIITLYNGNTYTDPSNENGVHEYWYDSNFTCYGTGQVVIYARTMEQSKNANYAEICTHGSPDSTNGAGAGSYVVILR